MAENTDEFKIKAIFEAVVSKFEKQIDSALKKSRRVREINWQYVICKTRC